MVKPPKRLSASVYLTRRRNEPSSRWTGVRVAASDGGLGRRSPGRETRRLLILVGVVLVALGLIAWLLVRPDSASHRSGLSRTVQPPAVARIDAGGMTGFK